MDAVWLYDLNMFFKSVYGRESFGHGRTMQGCHMFLLVTFLRGRETS